MQETPDMDRSAPAGTEPTIRFLKLLVTVLTGTMIVGLITIIALLVIRFHGDGDALVLPNGLKLPAGEQVQAVTKGKGWVAVVTE
ncbi:hypothetical protein FGG78_42510, partial [Thioclava sp. BHET1]